MKELIQEMTEIGWETNQFRESDGFEYITFRRKLKPNALVNFEILQKELDNPVLNLTQIWKQRILKCIKEIK